MVLTARLHPRKPKKEGEVYSVIFHGELLVERSSDPECDAAWPLLAKAISGKLTMLDGKTGKPRTVIDLRRLRGCGQWRREHTPVSEPLRCVQSCSPTAETDKAGGKKGWV